MNKQDAIKSVEKSTEVALTDCANRAKSSSSEFKALMIKAINSYKAQAIKMIEVANTEEAIKCLANKFNSEFLYNTAHAAVYKRMQMTPGKRAKQLGAKSLNQVAEETRQSLQTLSNWFYNKPELFDVVVAGVVKITGDKQ